MSGPILACYRIGTEVISTDLALLPRIRASPDFRRAGALSLQLLIAGKKKVHSGGAKTPSPSRKTSPKLHHTIPIPIRAQRSLHEHESVTLG